MKNHLLLFQVPDDFDFEELQEEIEKLVDARGLEFTSGASAVTLSVYGK